MRKHRNRIAVAAAAILAALALTACSGSGKAKDVDVAKTADALYETVNAKDSLSETQKEMLGSIYFFEDGQLVNSKVYMSDAATADEIVVAECKDEDAAKKAAELLNTRVKNQKDRFATYNPDEAPKLDKAIVKSSGKYVVLCVCDDYDKAESILKDAGF